MLTILEVFQKDISANYPLRTIIDNLTDEQVNECIQEYADETAIKFAEWIAHYGYEQDFDTKLWCYWDCGAANYTTKELYELFKTQIK